MATTLKNIQEFITVRNFSAPTGVNVGTSSTLILAARPGRKWAVICNDSDTDVYLAIEQAAVLNAGIRLNKSGGIYEINWNNLTDKAVYGIASASGKRVTVQEGW